MSKLKISHIKKTKEEYIKEGNEYYIHHYSSSRKTAMDFLKYNLEIEETKETIKSYYDNDRHVPSDGSDGERITNKDNIEYNEEYIRNTLFYVMNTTGEEQKLYYERLLFMETWKWDLFNMLTDEREINQFKSSKLYRQWKIKKVLS